MELSYFAIVIGAVFVNNVVLAQFLGICPFLGVSSKVETSLGMGAAVTFVMAIASVVAWLLQTYLLVPFGIEYMQTIVFILVIAALVQMVEIILKKVSPALYQALGIFLPLITTNCAVLGVAILMIQKEFSLLQGVVYAVSSALGFAGAVRGNPRAARLRGGARGIPRRSDRPRYGGHSGNGFHGVLGPRLTPVCCAPEALPSHKRYDRMRIHSRPCGVPVRDRIRPRYFLRGR